MDYHLLLIARAGSRAIDEELLAAARRLEAAEPLRLGEDACEIPLTPSLPEQLEVAVIRAIEDRWRPLVGARPVDIAVVPNHRRRKLLLLADMDSTFIWPGID